MSTGLQLVGLGLITAGTLLLSIPVGLIVAGIAAVLVGVSLNSA